ncbi:MAG: hypothetical protein A3F77_11770 [Betaproteobacteria bacterium RIFCSPLOWO2_12_FULL_67_28]|nr:MAG: hypothetical protein A3F77_11770 [Betaproteobacteria bacterium RIFCSPLOWO2_12_FULL_67_28]
MSAAAAQPRGDRLDRWLGYGCAAPIFLMVVLTFCEVFARYLFARPIRGSGEIIQFAMALTIFSGLPLVTRHRGHVAVSLIDNLLRGAARRVQQVLVDCASLAALGLITWRLWIQAGEYSSAGIKTVVIELAMAPLAYVMCAFTAGTCLVVLAQIKRTLSPA